MYLVIYDDVVYNHKIEYRQTIEPRILVLFLPCCCFAQKGCQKFIAYFEKFGSQNQVDGIANKLGPVDTRMSGGGGWLGTLRFWQIS